jgi:hypothetical protein
MAYMYEIISISKMYELGLVAGIDRKSKKSNKANSLDGTSKTFVAKLR